MLADLERIEGWVRQWEDPQLRTLLVGSQLGYVKLLAELQKDFSNARRSSSWPARRA